MLLLLNNIIFDPGLILIIIIFSLWGLSLFIGASIYLYKKCKLKRREIEDSPYSQL